MCMLKGENGNWMINWQLHLLGKLNYKLTVAPFGHFHPSSDFVWLVHACATYISNSGVFKRDQKNMLLDSTNQPLMLWDPALTSFKLFCMMIIYEPIHAIQFWWLARCCGQLHQKGQSLFSLVDLILLTSNTLQLLYTLIVFKGRFKGTFHTSLL